MARLRRILAAGLVLVAVAAGLLFAAARASAGSGRPKLSAEVLKRGESAQSCEGPAAVTARWAGVASVSIEACSGVRPATLLVDPYLTRHSLPELLFFPIDADEPTLERVFPRAEVILVGHSHHDHLGDVPSIARRTGATVVGTETTCVLAEAMGLPRTKCRVVSGFERFTVGDFDIEVLPHPHGSATPIGVPTPGTVTELEPGLPGVFEMRMGGALAFIVRTGGVTMYHQGSAGLADDQLARLRELRPDAAFVGLSLSGNTPDFVERLIGGLQPKQLVPIHHDPFFGATLDDQVQASGAKRLDHFTSAVARVSPSSKVLRPLPFEPISIAIPAPTAGPEGP